ncbi:LysR substrate-binding domain-containing protein [Variovorax sp. ZS18.2.2]|uniref:LysR family transcriptional regulator n=1 Tax=Variovorax sp. ZS18.2.2 TaxID=2971255 RepID=UPI002150D6C0|nr:LysR substrate-binding domain-containing protein [Variovorax sp. ZS18.2.2]MCR6480508.1 LysR substrate-binding domain-containing protein [Variovorax sp. ZS18.2.2]
MELRQFKYFLSIVDSGSVSRAAQHLHVAQSALSRQVAELESELGVQLLVRSRSGIVTTDAGKLFYEHARGITKQIDDLRNAIRNSAETISGSVIVALPQSVAVTLALALTLAVARDYPGLSFQLNEELSGHVVEQLTRGQIDLTILTDIVPRSDLVFVPLIEEAFVFLHSPTDPDAPPPGEVSLAQACVRPVVLPGAQNGHTTRWVIDAALRAAGLPVLRIAAEINSLGVLKDAVEAGIGPTILPPSLVQRELREGRLVAHSIRSKALVRVLCLCTARDVPESRARAAVCRLIERVARDLCESGRWVGARYVGPAVD